MGGLIMPDISTHIGHADWKLEKHVPVIETPALVKAGEVFEVRLTVGKEIAHPNTTEHHISWIDLYFYGEGEKYAHHVGRFEFTAHGESMADPNQGPVYAASQAVAFLKVAKPGVLHALAMCNIHGLWEGSQALVLG
jgi:superoxide reductase